MEVYLIHEIANIFHLRNLQRYECLQRSAQLNCHLPIAIDHLHGVFVLGDPVTLHEHPLALYFDIGVVLYAHRHIRKREVVASQESQQCFFNRSGRFEIEGEEGYQPHHHFGVLAGLLLHAYQVQVELLQQLLGVHAVLDEPCYLEYYGKNLLSDAVLERHNHPNKLFSEAAQLFALVLEVYATVLGHFPSIAVCSDLPNLLQDIGVVL